MGIDERVQVEIEYAGVPVSFVLPSPDDHISKILMAQGGFYEQKMLEALAPALREGDLVVDAGANIGNHTLFFAKILKCRVAAFEAVPATAAFLIANVAANGVTDRVQVHQIALGEHSGNARVIAYDETNVGGTTLELDEHGTIPIAPLDKVAIDGIVRLLKIDVEGMDLAVLKGAQGILQKDRPWVVCEAGNNASFRSIHEFMDGIGYTPIAVYNATDTFLFLPSRSDDERRQLINRGFSQMIAMQRDERELAARLAQAGRYSERMKGEALAEMQKRLEGWSSGDSGAEPASRLDARKIAAFERQLESSSAETADARAALLAERNRAAAQLTDVQARIDEHKKETALLLARTVQAKQMLDQQRESLNRLTATLAREKAAHEAQVVELRAAVERAAKAATAQASELTAIVTKRDGLLARQARALADTQRRLEDALRVVRIRNQSISDLEQAMAVAKDELCSLRGSVSFKLGVLIVSSMRSPLRAVGLLWNVPAFLWRAWRHKAGSPSTFGDRS